MLDCLGYEVVEAVDGLDALAVLERQTVDLVLSDVRMPRMGGRALAERVRARWPEVPVLLMTGYGPEIGGIEGLPVLPKPFSLEDLEAFLTRAAGAP